MRQIKGILIGVVVAIVLMMIAGSAFPQQWVRYVIAFGAGMFTGYIVDGNSWLSGLAVGLILTMVVGAILSRIAFQASRGQMFFGSVSAFAIVGCCFIVSSTVGGAIGGLLKKK